jgi:hypothetical protein
MPVPLHGKWKGDPCNATALPGLDRNPAGGAGHDGDDGPALE